MFVVLLVMAPSSQELEPPANPGRFSVRLPILANFSNLDASLLDAAQSQFGDDLVGTISSSWYLPDFEFSANRMFATSMRREFNSAPGLNAAAAYTFGAVLEQALQKLGGDIEDRQRFTETLRGSEVFDTIRGPVKFDERGNVVGIIFIAKASRISRSNTALLGNEPIKTYPFVSQFWTYDPKKFLSGRAFSREYPPAHYLER
ncbi:ABC transporter substrate-binding protein [Bradyrhizobium sp. 76]|uniref:ABC transporter substrate-binding protein n=1 Tax=Bradyrhizobium sp. 76 TaxID=2782680 RepID=UPI001FF70BC0|nr:ABC transporter substrate-binding protein [Bradyrhizobium sp. 76]